MQEAAINKAYVEADRGDSFIAISKIQLIPFEEVMPELRTIYAKVYLLSYLNYTSGNSMISTKEIQQAWQNTRHISVRTTPNIMSTSYPPYPLPTRQP